MSEGRRFFLQERIGAGAFGEVFLAEQDSGAGFRRKVAIKLLHAHHEGLEDASRRMRDEARILGRLSHRNIVTVLDLVRLDDRWAVVMDYIPGADLERVLIALEKDGEPFPVAAALEVGAAVCDALDAAFHADDGSGGQLSVVHRDIKPSNIRITADGDVKVLDFGVARVEMDTREAQTGQYRMGTERYMAPERIVGDPEGPSGDVYALGATIAELLLGRPLGRTPVIDDRHAVFIADQLLAVAERLGEGELATDVCAVLGRSLAYDVNERPSAGELSEAFTDLARRATDEALRPFARGFVRRVDLILGSASEAVDAILSERTTPAGVRDGGTIIPDYEERSGITFAPDNETFVTSDDLGSDRQPLADSEPAPPPAQTHVGVLVGIALGLVAILVGGGGLLLRGLPTDAPQARGAVEEAVGDRQVRSSIATEAADEPVEVEPAADTTGAEADALPNEPPAAAPPEPARARAPAAPARITPVAKPAADAPRIRRALVVLDGASSIRVTCADQTGSGTASASIRDFAAGECEVQVVYLGRALETRVQIERPREVVCAIDGETLACR